MKYFILFSMILIVASVTILMMPPSETETEGFTPDRTDDDDGMYRNLQQPAPAGHRRNASSTAGAADGTSDHQHLLDGLLAKHDRLFEAFENKVKNIPGVSATTTQKNGIASTTETII